MIANVVIGALIFGYAGYALVRHIRKSREGKCASCSSKSSCGAAGCDDGAAAGKNSKTPL